MSELPTIIYILIFIFLGSIASLIGGVVLLAKAKLAYRLSHLLASYAAGALLGAAFFDLLPEAAEEAEHHALEYGGEAINIFVWTLLGVLFFFLLERIIHWFHHHTDHQTRLEEPKPIVPLVMLGDSVHNFIDGVVIAATFMVSIPTGIITALAVATHEIPQEIGDFGILLKQGLTRKKVLLFNLLSALTAVLGGLVTYFMGDAIDPYLPIFLAITAGFFIYIALSDLVPEMHHINNRKLAVLESGLLLLGVAVVWISVLILEPIGH